MEQANQTIPAATPQPSRSSATRKLLSRKAAESKVQPMGEALETSFPSIDATLVEPAPAPQQSSSNAPAPLPAQTPPALAAWSSEDEASYQGLLARRKAAGYQRRGRDVAGQLLRMGELTPNAGTVVATIVSLVAERGTITRSELLDAMAAAIFPHPKARPQDRNWCQGYVAGAVRDGFLAMTQSEKSPT